MSFIQWTNNKPFPLNYIKPKKVNNEKKQIDSPVIEHITHNIINQLMTIVYTQNLQILVMGFISIVLLFLLIFTLAIK